MAIAYDSSSQGYAGPGGGYASWSHTCTGTNLILLVSVYESANSNGVSGITYNGVALTQIGTVSNGNTQSLWYLINPATGSHTIAVSGSHTTNTIWQGAISYTGAKQTGQPDSFNTATSQTTVQTISTTVVANNSWLVAAFGVSDNNPPSAGTGTTSRQGFSGSGSGFIGDSNGTVASGSRSLVSNNAANDTTVAVIASIAPTDQIISTVSDTNVTTESVSAVVQSQSVSASVLDTNVSTDTTKFSISNKWSPEIVPPTTIWTINNN